MGLDNGIIIKNLNKEDFKLFKITKDETRESGPEVEICYWRKCWGIRNTIMKVLHMKEDEGTHIIETDDIPALIRALKPFFSKEYWEENGDSIWEFDEMFLSNLKYIIRLGILENYMKEHPELEVYFYDSY